MRKRHCTRKFSCQATVAESVFTYTTSSPIQAIVSWSASPVIVKAQSRTTVAAMWSASHAAHSLANKMGQGPAGLGCQATPAWPNYSDLVETLRLGSEKSIPRARCPNLGLVVLARTNRQDFAPTHSEASRNVIHFVAVYDGNCCKFPLLCQLQGHRLVGQPELSNNTRLRTLAACHTVIQRLVKRGKNLPSDRVLRRRSRARSETVHAITVASRIVPAPPRYALRTGVDSHYSSFQ